VANPEIRQKTTEGIWAESSMQDSPFIVLDLEGCDGREKSGDARFDKQASLFALVMSDIIIINLKEGEVGRYNAAGFPLLKSIFQVLLAWRSDFLNDVTGSSETGRGSESEVASHFRCAGLLGSPVEGEHGVHSFRGFAGRMGVGSVQERG